MDAAQALSLTAVLLLALYGAACLLTAAVLRFLRPRENEVRLVLHLCGTAERTEAQLRYALELAKRHRLPLSVIEEGLDEEATRIVDMLLRRENADRMT